MQRREPNILHVQEQAIKQGLADEQYISGEWRRSADPDTKKHGDWQNRHQ